MKLFHKVVFLPWYTCLISFLLHSAVMGSNSVSLPRTSLWQFSQLSKDTDAIVESEKFAQFTYVVTVDLKATDNNTCYPPDQQRKSSSTGITCKSLNDALQIYRGISSVVFYLADPEEVYYLNFTYNATNQDNIWFYGNSSWSQASIPTVKCLENVGLSFINSFNISFSNVEFFNCGFNIQTSSSKNFSNIDFPIRVGLYIYNCTNITMHHIRVLNSPRAAGVAMYDTDGIVEVYNSTFANNSVQTYGNQSGGGGFAVEFTYCKPGDSTCSRRNKNSLYSFYNCTFRENTAINSGINHAYVVKMAKYYLERTGQGGGLKITIKSDASNNSFSLKNCQFFKNRATWGGGLHIEMDNQCCNNSIVVSNCNFSNNSALFEQNDTNTAGGAIGMITTAKNFNRLHIKDCNFMYNQASKGGGICLHIARQANIDDQLEILISNCLFESNSARIGSALIISAFPIFTHGVLPKVHIHDSTFANNHYLYLSTKIHAVEIAVVYVSDIPVSFQNHVVFDSNIGSALTAIGTQLDFNDTTAYFSNNTGDDGGAIALLGAAIILIGPNTRMIFMDNVATRYGGAIYNRYVSIEHLMSTEYCFLQYSEPLTEPDNWLAHFNFSGNRAYIGGCSIFTSALAPCTWKLGSRAFRWKNWNYDNNNTKCKPDIAEISTEAKSFNSSKSNWSISDPIEISPGNIFRIPMGAYDDLENDVTNDTIYSAQLLDDKSKLVADIGNAFSYLVSNYIRLTGKPGSHIKLHLKTERFRQMDVILNVILQKCPPGFFCSQNDTDCNSITNVKQIRCQCPSGKFTYRNNLRCNQVEFLSNIRTNYWYGEVHFEHINKTLLLMGSVPLAYRSQNMASEADTIELPKSFDEIDKRLCGDVHREGVLCGECVEGYAVAVNSRTYECVQCDRNNTTPGEFIKFLCAYIALTYFPITIFFILIISFDIKLASSAAAGFVVYAQIISTGNFLYPQVPNGAAQVIRTIQLTVYGIFNLESFAFLMPPFCLNENFTTLHVLCLDYAVAVFPLVMIMIIYLPYKCKLLCCKCNCRTKQGTADSEKITDADSDSSTSTRSISTSQRPCCNKPPKSTLIHAFTAFMLLSYTKFGLASMKTVFLTELFDAQGAPKAQRIYLAGHLYFSDPQFLFPFGILAILVLVFVVFLPPLFLLGPLQLIDWLTDKPKFRCIHRFWPSITIHTFLDTFQGYKPNRRFFAGLHLLLRLVLFLVFSFSPDPLSQYVIQLIIILIFFTLISLLRPYAKEYYNCLDILLLLNLGFLNAITVYVSERNYTAGIYALECILIFLPLIYMVCYVIWNKARKRKYYKKVKERISRRLVNPVKSSGEETKRLLKSNGNDPFSETLNYSSDDPDEEIFQRAAKGNRFRTANIQTHPPSRSGGVYKSVVSILEPQVPKTEGEVERSATNQSDSGIGGQSNSGRSLSSLSNTMS